MGRTYSPVAARGRWSVALVAALLALLALVAAACSDASDDALDVFAAASLANAFEEIAVAYEADAGQTVRLNLAGTSALREQLRDGAQADVFVSANQTIMAELVADGTVSTAPVDMAVNEIVLAVPSGNPAAVTGIADLADPDRFVGLCAAAVPCGALARAVLDDVGVVASVDTELPDVRALARRIEDGELDAGLVYATDVAAAGGGLVSVELPDGVAGQTVYPIAAVADADPDADAFIAYVLGPEGSAILERWGFRRP